MAIHVHCLRMGEIAACVDILATSEPWDRYGVTAESARALFSSAQRRGARIRVATLDGKVAGFIWFTLRGAFHHSGYIWLIGVAKECRGQGVGWRLMATAEEEMRAHVKSVTLLVSDFNSSAQQFYEALGYRKVGELPDYVVSGITEYIYYKPLGTIGTGAALAGTSPATFTEQPRDPQPLRSPSFP